MNKKNIQEILQAILIGAFVAFITTFLEGTLEYMQGLENNTAGAVAASAKYIFRHVA